MLYQIVTNISRTAFEIEVSRLMREGWELQGGVSVSHSEYERFNIAEGHNEVEEITTFAQAVIKRPGPSVRFSEDGTVERLNPETSKWEVLHIPEFT